MQRALDRYDRLLLLAARHPGVALAPTRDIDEMWHLHMLSPRGVGYHPGGNWGTLWTQNFGA